VHATADTRLQTEQRVGGLFMIQLESDHTSFSRAQLRHWHTHDKQANTPPIDAPELFQIVSFTDAMGTITRLH